MIYIGWTIIETEAVLTYIDCENPECFIYRKAGSKHKYKLKEHHYFYFTIEDGILTVHHYFGNFKIRKAFRAYDIAFPSNKNKYQLKWRRYKI